LTPRRPVVPRLAVAALVLLPPAAPAQQPPLDLGALLAEAEAANPEVLAAAARLRSSAHVPSQVEALPDPELVVSYTNDSVTAFTLGDSTDSELWFTWIQEVPYPGKRRLAGEVARAGIDVEAAALEATRWRVRAAVKGVYAELFRLHRTAEILEESRAVLVSFRETARARYEAGEAILENVLKAQTEEAKLDADLLTLAQERRAAEAGLLELLGRREEAGLGPALALPEAAAADPGALEAAALARAPDLLLLRAAAAQEERQVDLARRGLKPDFLWTAGYANRGDLDPMVMGGVGVRLPAYRRRKQAQALAQSEQDLEAARRDLDARANAVVAEIRDLVARAERADGQIRLYREAILPQAEAALEAASASYRVGRAEFVTLLDDFRSVLGFKVAYEAQRTDQVKALAAIEPLVGMDLVLAPAAGAAGGSHE
jgi:outer membrane protein TolC